MRYSQASMKTDLQTLGVSHWDWAGATPGQVREDVQRDNPRIRSGNDDAFIEELTVYCWQAYTRALQSHGDVDIGREKHLKAMDLYGRVGDMTGPTSTLFDAEAQGNLLLMDKWAAVMNDCWILGAIHRRATFRLISRLTMDNIWNFRRGFMIVTARELIGILNFGYEAVRAGPYKLLRLTKPVAATTADLIKYDKLTKKVTTPKDLMFLLHQF